MFKTKRASADILMKKQSVYNKVVSSASNGQKYRYRLRLFGNKFIPVWMLENVYNDNGNPDFSILEESNIKEYDFINPILNQKETLWHHPELDRLFSEWLILESQPPINDKLDELLFSIISK